MALPQMELHLHMTAQLRGVLRSDQAAIWIRNKKGVWSMVSHVYNLSRGRKRKVTILRLTWAT